MARMTREMTVARSHLANLHQIPHTPAQMCLARQRVHIARIKRDITVAELDKDQLRELAEYALSL